MNCQLIIKNAEYYANGGFNQGDILVEDGRITAIIAPGTAGELSAQQVIDAAGLKVLPGIIDSHVHFREPGRTDREDFFSGSCAAAAGGVTTFCEMPNAFPPPNCPENLQNRIGLAAEKALVDFALLGAAGFGNREQFQPLLDLGVVAFKTFLDNPPKGREAEFAGLTVADDGELYLMLQAAAQTEGRFFFHCENTQVIKAMEQLLHQQGESSNAFHYLSRPDVAEVQSVETVIRFARATGAKVGIVHITVPEACRMVRQAKAEGVDVVAETCFQYLTYHHGHIDQYGPYAKCNPPLRSREDMEGLWEYLLDGTITMIGSDHAPLTEEEKIIGLNDGIWKAFSGFPGVEVMLPVMLTEVNAGKLSLAQLVRLMSENTARLHGLFPRKGVIQPGADADFTIVDMNKEVTLSCDKMYTKAKAINKMFEGQKVKGYPVYTIVRGTTVMNNGTVDTSLRGYGKYVPAAR